MGSASFELLLPAKVHQNSQSNETGHRWITGNSGKLNNDARFRWVVLDTDGGVQEITKSISEDGKDYPSKQQPEKPTE
jgi:hypothetical protein